MTQQDLKEYLKGIVSGGVQINNLDRVAEVAAETGYNSVWGAYTWKIKRVEDSALPTIASQAHTVLPEDFESMLSIRLRFAGRPLWIDLTTEIAFDKNWPLPTDWNQNSPRHAKVVYSPKLGWRIYWFPIPDAAYSTTVMYERKADIGNLPQLPSYMVDAIVAKASSLMVFGPERAQADQVAARAVGQAIGADNAVSGSTPQFGMDYGWNDWARGRTGSDDPHIL